MILAPATAAQVLSTNPLQIQLLPVWNAVQNTLLSNKTICANAHLQKEIGSVKMTSSEIGQLNLYCSCTMQRSAYRWRENGKGYVNFFYTFVNRVNDTYLDIDYL